MNETMTIVTIPSDNYIGFTTRFDRRRSPFKDALLRLSPGDPLTLTDTMGDLVLPLDSSIPLVFVAGGVAIASYISMLRWLTQTNDSRRITLLYAVRSAADIIYTDVFSSYMGVGDLTSNLYSSVIRKDVQKDGAQNMGSDIDFFKAWPGEIGGTRISSEEIMRHVQPYSQIYLSGTEQMVEQLRIALQTEYKIPQYRLAFDFFEGYTEI